MRERGENSIPRFAQPGEETPEGATRHIVDGQLAFISSPDKYQPMIGSLRRNQQEDVETLLEMTHPDRTRQLIREEMLAKVRRQTRKYNGANRRGSERYLKNLV